MLGTVEFNSACYYRYANVDVGQLKSNLQNDEELARKGLKAFLEAFALAVPSGKQNSMAAQNPPSFVMTVAGERGPWSLANAFVKPVSGQKQDLVAESVSALDNYWGGLSTMYGDGGRRVAVSTLHPEGLEALSGYQKRTLEEVINEAVEAAFGKKE